MPIKVLHVYKVYVPENFTGIPRVIHGIAEGASRYGIESHVLSLTETVTDTPTQIGGHWAHYARRDLHIASTSFSVSVFAKYKNLVEDVDLVHYHLPWPLADVLHLSHGESRPSIATYHSDIVKQRLILPIYSLLMHRFLNRIDAIVATSPQYADTSRILARHREKVSVIPIGIDERKPPRTALIEAWRERVGDNFFLFVGSLRYYKGLPYLIEAARQTGFPVIVAGDRKLCDFNINTVPANMRFIGEISEEDKEALLSLSRAFVFPSHLRSEAFGVALLEAARAARPLISCEIGTGTSFVNANGETGLVIKPADVESLSGAMRWCLEHPEAAERMGVNARARFERHFRADAMCASYVSLYRQLVAPRR